MGWFYMIDYSGIEKLLKEREKYTMFSLWNQGYCHALKDVLYNNLDLEYDLDELMQGVE